MKTITTVRELENAGDEVYIYGTGFKAKLLYHFLSDGKRVKGFVATASNKKMLYDKAVINVWDINKDEYANNKFLIAVYPMYWEEIEKTLLALGINQDNIFAVDYVKMVEQKNGMEINGMIEALPFFKRFSDEESRLIYQQGCKYRLTNDYLYFMEIMERIYKPDTCRNMKYKNFAQWIIDKNYKDSKVVLYIPSEYWIEATLPRLLEMGIKVDCICTNQKKLCKQLIFGIPVIDLEKAVENIKDSFFLVGCGMRRFNEDVEKILKNAGIPDDKMIIPCNEIAFFNIGYQYFDLKELKNEDEEVFVDAGCLNCGTDLQFIKWCNGNYKTIYAFESDRLNYEKCIEVKEKENIKNLVLVDKGLWNKSTKLTFLHNENKALSKICKEGKEIIETVTLDEYLDGEKITFIKMDIEGAELNALKGAENSIREHKPKLAISLYHNVNDWIDIVEYLAELVPAYKFYLRHYSCYKYETILYAII